MTPPLPPPVETVRTPDALPVSGLGAAVACPLSAALPGPGVEPLPTHPRAVYGGVLHGLYEAAVRGEVEPGPGFPDRMHAELDRRVARLPADVPPPEAVYGYVDWLQRASDVVARSRLRAEEAWTGEGGGTPDRRPTPGARTASAPAAPAPEPPFVRRTRGRWTELPLTSPALGVRGRADLVERDGRRIVVTDLKTGSLGGTAAGDAALQLRAYGLVVLEWVPDAEVHLAVEAASVEPVPFGPADRDAARQALADLARRLPPGETARAADLARPGAACRFCAVRHRCLAYRAAAPRWWRDGTDHPAPVDVWGRVESVQPAPRGVALALRDAAGRLAHVARLRPGYADGVRPGDAFHAFGLRGRPGRTDDGLALAPTRYHDLDADGAVGAWTLATFASRPQGGDADGPTLPAPPPTP